MSRLDELIAELCPDGVEYKTLGELGAFYGGLSGKSKDDFQDGNAKFITYVNVFSNISLNTDVSEFVKVREDEKQNTIQYGDIIFTGSSETPEECEMSSVLTHHVAEKLYLNSFCFGFRLYDNTALNPAFSKYLFRSESVRTQIKKTASGVTRFNVSKEKMKKVQIPLPPLEVQREIVRILDAFTELTAELTAELDARKKQYEYYRDDLLTFTENHPFADLFPDGVEYVELGKFAKAEKGKNVGEKCKTAYSITKGGLVLTSEYFKDAKITSSDTSGYRIVKKNWFVYSPSRIDVGSINYLREDIEVIVSPLNVVFSVNEGIIVPAYLLYCLQSRSGTWQILTKRIGIDGTGRKLLPFDVFSTIKIPLPPLAEQERIVSILDRFDKLCNDISEGIPAEIEARRKQYEHYRDRLLTFKEKPA